MFTGAFENNSRSELKAIAEILEQKFSVVSVKKQIF
jgi:hypothetical protein